MKTRTREQIMNCSDFNQLLNAEYGQRGTQTREQFEAEAEAFVLGELLKQERENAGLTQQQLANQSGCAKTTIARLEQGHSNVSLSSIFHIFAGMGKKVAISLLTTLLLLTLGVGQMWGAKEDSNPRTAQDTAYIITPNISTQDAIYIKHEDIKPVEKTWWEIYGGVVESLLAILAGAGVSLFTTWLKDRQEEKRFEQELHNKRQMTITDEGIRKEHEIYYSLLDIQNESDNVKIQTVLQSFKLQLDKAKLDMTPSLYLLANDMYVYFRGRLAGTEDRDEQQEQQMFEKYYATFTNA